VLEKETFSPAKAPLATPKKNLLATPLKKLPKPKQNDSSSSDDSPSPHYSFHAREREKKAERRRAREAKLPSPKDGEKTDSESEPLEMSDYKGEEADDKVPAVDILMSQESEQDQNAAGATSNSNSDSDSDSEAKLPSKPIGLKSKKKRNAIESDQESDDASAVINRVYASDDDKKPAAVPTQRSEANPSPGSPGFNRLMSTLENDADPLGQYAATYHMQSPSGSAANEEPVVGLKPEGAVPRKQPKVPAEMVDMSNDASTTDDDDDSGTKVETGTAEAGGDDTLSSLSLG